MEAVKKPKIKKAKVNGKVVEVPKTSPDSLEELARTNPVMALSKWAKESLRIPYGHPLAGQAMEIPQFAQEFLAGALKSRESLLCVARKNGKSSIIAILILGLMVGPLRQKGMRIGCVSLSMDKVRELKKLCIDICEASELEGIRWYKTGVIAGVSQWCTLDILPHEANAGQSSGYDYAIMDELGLFSPSARELVTSMRSSVSARDGRVISLSIFGDSPFIPELLERKDDDRIHVALYQASADADITDEKSWLSANPGLGTIKSMEYMRDAATRAKRIPADLPSFVAHDLNLPASPDKEMLVTIEDWKQCEVEELPERKGPVYLGVDLGGSMSMCAWVAYWPETQRMESQCALGDDFSPTERGRRDGVGSLYTDMVARGELLLHQGRMVDLVIWASQLHEIMSDQHVIGLGIDRFRRQELINALQKAEISWPIVSRGTGFLRWSKAADDVRSFQRYCIEGRIKHRPSLIARNALAESSLRYDQGGNPSLDKERRHARIDWAQAAVIAIGLAAATPVEAKPRFFVA